MMQRLAHRGTERFERGEIDQRDGPHHRLGNDADVGELKPFRGDEARPAPDPAAQKVRKEVLHRPATNCHAQIGHQQPIAGAGDGQLAALLVVGGLQLCQLFVALQHEEPGLRQGAPERRDRMACRSRPARTSD